MGLDGDDIEWTRDTCIRSLELSGRASWSMIMMDGLGISVLPDLLFSRFDTVRTHEQNSDAKHAYHPTPCCSCSCCFGLILLFNFYFCLTSETIGCNCGKSFPSLFHTIMPSYLPLLLVAFIRQMRGRQKRTCTHFTIKHHRLKQPVDAITMWKR